MDADQVQLTDVDLEQLDEIDKLSQVERRHGSDLGRNRFNGPASSSGFFTTPTKQPMFLNSFGDDFQKYGEISILRSKLDDVRREKQTALDAQKRFYEVRLNAETEKNSKLTQKISTLETDLKFQEHEAAQATSELKDYKRRTNSERHQLSIHAHHQLMGPPNAKRRKQPAAGRRSPMKTPMKLPVVQRNASQFGPSIETFLDRPNFSQQQPKTVDVSVNTSPARPSGTPPNTPSAQSSCPILLKFYDWAIFNRRIPVDHRCAQIVGPAMSAVCRSVDFLTDLLQIVTTTAVAGRSCENFMETCRIFLALIVYGDSSYLRGNATAILDGFHQLIQIVNDRFSQLSVADIDVIFGIVERIPNKTLLSTSTVHFLQQINPDSMEQANILSRYLSIVLHLPTIRLFECTKTQQRCCLITELTSYFSRQIKETNSTENLEQFLQLIDRQFELIDQQWVGPSGSQPVDNIPFCRACVKRVLDFIIDEVLVNDSADENLTGSCVDAIYSFIFSVFPKLDRCIDEPPVLAMRSGMKCAAVLSRLRLTGHRRERVRLVLRRYFHFPLAFFSQDDDDDDDCLMDIS